MTFAISQDNFNADIIYLKYKDIMKVKQINKNINKLRIQNKLTQRQLSNALNISLTTISKWETGAREPTIEQLIILAKFFKCTTDYLLGLE